MIIKPGDTIIETMQGHSISKQDLAKQLNLSLEAVYQLLAGTIAINEDIAQNLAKLFDIPADFWLKLELKYQEELALIKELSDQ